MFYEKSGKGVKTMSMSKRDKVKTDRGQKVHKDWYKLDLSAIVYPTLQRRDFSSVYRLSVLLKEEINPEMLQRAVNLTMPRFPTYKAAIRKGVFWRYLEPNDRPGPFVQEDVKNPCQPMYFKANNRYLVRIYYYRNRIALEAHHSLGDGTGGMCVLQTLTATYLRLKGHTEIENGGFVLDILETPDPVELEDAYMKYANAKVCPPRPGEKTYRVRGTKEPFYTLNIIDGIMSVAEVMKVAKSYNATITEYLNAVLLYALMQKQESEWHLKLRPVKIAMPRYYLNEKLLRGDITTNAETQRNPFIRVVPLFIKDLVVRQFYTKIQDKNSSAGLTNMGALKVPETMKPYIERFDIYMGQPFSTRTNCAIASFEDILTINFASSIAETDVERLFFRKLVQDGIHVKIESNR